MTIFIVRCYLNGQIHGDCFTNKAKADERAAELEAKRTERNVYWKVEALKLVEGK